MNIRLQKILGSFEAAEHVAFSRVVHSLCIPPLTIIRVSMQFLLDLREVGHHVSPELLILIIFVPVLPQVLKPVSIEMDRTCHNNVCMTGRVVRQKRNDVGVYRLQIRVRWVSKPCKKQSRPRAGNLAVIYQSILAKDRIVHEWGPEIFRVSKNWKIGDGVRYGVGRDQRKVEVSLGRDDGGI
jgi:hypothetical protein